MIRPEWHGRANCGRNGKIGDDPKARISIMFSGTGTYVCEGCPVKAECLAERDHLMRASVAMGTWGGRVGAEIRIVACVICGEEFERFTSRALTCSDECRMERNRRKERERSARYRLSGAA